MNAFLFVLMFVMHTPSQPPSDLCLSGGRPIIRNVCTPNHAPAPKPDSGRPIIRNS